MSFYLIGGSMSESILYGKNLNDVLSRVMDSIKVGQDELFSISENIRQENENLKIEMENLKRQVSKIIDEVDAFEVREKLSRKKLSLVSKGFDKYDEEDIRGAYEEARDIQIKLIVKREEEKNMINRRTELELRFKKNRETIHRIDGFVSKMSSVMDFLVGDLSNVNEKISDLEDKTQMGMKIIRAQEEERRRIARDIHDGPAQSLATLVVRSEVMNKIADEDTNLLKEEISSMKSLLKSTLKEIRRIMYDLRPMSLDDLGLVSTLKRLISDIVYEKNIEINLNVLNDEKIFSPLLRLTIFRLIQESINNACKHSGTNEILIKLDIKKDRIIGVVQDFGCGFDLEKLKSKGSFGISSMNERVNLLNGKLTIDSKEGEGTKVIFDFPNEEVVYE